MHDIDTPKTDDDARYHDLVAEAVDTLVFLRAGCISSRLKLADNVVYLPGERLRRPENAR